MKSIKPSYKKNDKNNSRFSKKDFKKKPNKLEKPFYSNKEIDTTNLEKIVWIYSQAQNYDFGFIDVPWVEKWYFVYPKNANQALDWDEVKAYVKVFRWRKEAVITEVVKRADRVFVWNIILNKWFWFVVLDNQSMKRDVYISDKKLSKFKDKIKSWDKVAIKITKWEGKNPEWSIIEVLWDWNKSWIDVLSLILEAWLKTNFPNHVLEEADKLKFEIWENRVDLTDKLTFTIDWEDARDLDDAITLEKIWEKYKLIVSIADVSEYVKEGTSLDKEALKRWNSTYLADRVIPMLPEKISNDLCSLNPNTKKLTLSSEIILDKFWNVLEKKVYNSIIKSSFRLTYKEVQEIIDKKLNIKDELMFGWNVTSELLEAINNSYILKQKIESRKQSSWVLNFDFDETKIILDENNNPTDIVKYIRYESNKIIEEFMILANESVWELFSKYPFIYRIHDIPDDEDIEKLRTILNIFGITMPFWKTTPKFVSNILKEIEKSPKSLLLSKLVLRSLKKAIYSEENRWHFGLGLEFYSHFTSPIRRYSDLQIHRIIKEKISKNLTKSRISHYEEILPTVAKKVSDTEIKSQKLEYAVRDLMIAKYYQDKIWQEFIWTISWTIPAWFFVVLENTSEWLVNIEEFCKQNKIKRCEYNEQAMKFEVSKDLFLQVWDVVKIKIREVELEKRRINFDFVEKIQ